MVGPHGTMRPPPVMICRRCAIRDWYSVNTSYYPIMLYICNVWTTQRATCSSTHFSFSKYFNYSVTWPVTVTLTAACILVQVASSVYFFVVVVSFSFWIIHINLRIACRRSFAWHLKARMIILSEEGRSSHKLDCYSLNVSCPSISQSIAPTSISVAASTPNRE